MLKNIIFFLVCLFSLNVSASGGVTLSSTLAASSQNQLDDIFTQPEFLKVDEAFVLQSESTDKGIKLSWKIADDYYLYKERFKFKITKGEAQLGEPQFSQTGKAKEDPYFGLVHVIHDAVEVFLPVNLSTGNKDAEVKITYQGCAEAGLCYPPKHQYILFIPSTPDAQTPASSSISSSTPVSASEKISFSNPISPSITPAENELNLDEASGVFNFIQNSSLPLIVGIFFLLGLGLTFTPCVFPMIPIITSIIAGQKKPTTGKSFALSSAYVLGMAATYAAAGVITGLLGAGANIQAALQDPYLLSAFAIIFILLALAMFGLYELQLPTFLRDRLNNTSQNLSGGHITSVFLIGALSALIVSPCVSAPLAGALLYISSTADAVIGGLSLFSLGLGMGLPLIIISVGGGKFLPKAGHWMDKVKQFFGIMLIAVAIWLLSRFLPESISMGLWAILLGITATQMGAFDAALPGWPRIAKGAGLLLALYASLLLIGTFSGAHNPLKPLEGLSTIEQTNTNKTSNYAKVDFKVIYNLAELNQQIRIAKQQEKPILVDFYADWCISCIVMENQVFPQPEIRSKLDNFHLVKADVTDNNDENQALLNQFGLFGPPSILLFDKKGNEHKGLRMVGEISKEGFERRLVQALGN